MDSLPDTQKGVRNASGTQTPSARMLRRYRATVGDLTPCNTATRIGPLWRRRALVSHRGSFPDGSQHSRHLGRLTRRSPCPGSLGRPQAGVACLRALKPAHSSNLQLRQATPSSRAKRRAAPQSQLHSGVVAVLWYQFVGSGPKDAWIGAAGKYQFAYSALSATQVLRVSHGSECFRCGQSPQFSGRCASVVYLSLETSWKDPRPAR